MMQCSEETTMTRCLRESIRLASPTVGAHAAEPLSVDEIDAMPNADRVWATIMLLRGDKY